MDRYTNRWIERQRVCVRVCERGRECVQERERERERDRVCVRKYGLHVDHAHQIHRLQRPERERESVCERERERESVCVCVRESVCERDLVDGVAQRRALEVLQGPVEV